MQKKDNKVKITQTEVAKTKDMNDRDFLTDMLATEKNMSVNMTIALNEASNEQLLTKLESLFNAIKQCQRDLYELAFSKGWYALEKAETTKMDEKFNDMKNKFDELN